MRVLALTALVLASCSPAGTADPICSADLGGYPEWWIHHSTDDGECIQVSLHPRGAVEPIPTIESVGPFVVLGFAHLPHACETDVFSPGDIERGTLDVSGWAHTEELTDRLHVVMDVTVAFPETSWRAARSDRIQIRGTTLGERLSCFREWPTPP